MDFIHQLACATVAAFRGTLGPFRSRQRAAAPSMNLRFFLSAAVIVFLSGDALADKIPTSAIKSSARALKPLRPHPQPKVEDPSLPHTTVPHKEEPPVEPGNAKEKIAPSAGTVKRELSYETAFRQSLREYEEEPVLRYYGRNAEVETMSGTTALDNFLAQAPKRGTSIRIDESALLEPAELKKLVDAGVLLHVRESVTQKIPVRVVANSEGELEALVDVKPTLSVSGNVYAKLVDLRDIDARQIVEKMRVVLLVNPKDLRQIEEYRKVVGSKLFVPRDSAELSQYLSTQGSKFYVVAGHSEAGVFKVQRADGETLFEVPFEQLNADIGHVRGAQLTLSCSAACQPGVSGPSGDVSHRQVTELLAAFKNEEHLLGMMERATAISNIPLVLRRDFKDSGKLMIEADVSRLKANSIRPTGRLVLFRSEVRTPQNTARRSNEMVPVMIDGLLRSEVEELQADRRRIIGYGVLALIAPLLVWGGLAVLMLFNFENPAQILSVISKLVDRDFENDMENEQRFLTSNKGIFFVGGYAAAWSAGLAFCIFFGLVAIAFKQPLLCLAVVTIAGLSQLFWKPGARAFFADFDGIIGLLILAVWRAIGWVVPASLVVFGFCLVEHWGSGDVKMYFPHDEEVTLVALILTIGVGVVNFLAARSEDIGGRVLQVITWPWALMLRFDQHRLASGEAAPS